MLDQGRIVLDGAEVEAVRSRWGLSAF
jgi:hypothetical protein